MSVIFSAPLALFVLGALSANAQPTTTTGQPTENVDQATYTVTDYNPDTDYFPEKVATDHSAFWSVEYFNSYKVVTDSFSNYTYVMYQRGTPEPVLEELNLAPTMGTSIFPVPLGTLTVDQTIPLRFLEVLGDLQNLKYAPASTYQYATSACLQKIGETSNYTLSDDAELRRAQIDSTDLHMVAQSMHPEKDTEEYFIYTDGITSDPGVLHRAEWIEYLSLPMNKEKIASDDFAIVRDNYMSYNETMASVTGDKPKVAWITTGDNYGPAPDYAIDGKKWEIVDAGYKHEYMRDANLEAIPAGRYLENNKTDFYNAIKDADLVIDESYFYGIKNSTYFMTTYNISEADAAEYKFLQATPHAVFGPEGTINENYGSDWFESAVYYADRVLLDIIQISRPDEAIVQNHTRTWFYNFATETPFIITSANCTTEF
ncbi:hypothetical protein SARC_06324 [Sphaeroforma arctica JP610]|uniref:Uncharacterized protein n=1 Tax=Sphaeroforma arctica JP610 TaxID=667725 RepID=A0A0L0FWY0_9EUKA|nr:hypothetical protein SARC_06324 [Sphaeroforma arctica JP610]KNC81350.1 hypothetical protein SARC_06324 [Sphaeroforma arctica JP610]|eukprot:XP_014155252.1 hypothetical protein SARC_06324 [Sphaeroforma arctica JP610]